MFSRAIPLPRGVTALLLTVWGLHPFQVSAAWLLDRVDAPKEFWFSSLAFDTSGRPAIACGEDALYYARWDAAGWTIETVDRLACPTWQSRPSLAFDPSGHPAISYIHLSQNELRLARWNGSDREIERVESSVEVGEHSPLAFDADGHPAIA